MDLKRRLLAEAAWNSTPESFGLNTPPEGKEGATVGPGAVAYAHGRIYVLDSFKERVLEMDRDGHILSSTSLPVKVASDLVVDSTDGSLFVVDHLNDTIYRIKDGRLTLVQSVPLRRNFPFGTQFAYDPASATLYAIGVEFEGAVPLLRNGEAVAPDTSEAQKGLFAAADFDGNRLLVTPPGGQGALEIAFDIPVACVEETAADAQGIIWVLYTLEGDQRMRRLARVDPFLGAAETAAIDVWFAYDGTRRMIPTDSGVVILAGDDQTGRLLAFDRLADTP